MIGGKWSTVALLPLAGGLGVVLLEAVRQIDDATIRAAVAGGGLVLTYALGLATRAADLRWPQRKKPDVREDAEPASQPD